MATKKAEKTTKATTEPKTTKKSVKTESTEEVKENKEVKTAAKKTAAKKTEVSVILQYAEIEVSTEDVVNKAKEAYIAAGHKENEIKSLKLYLKPDERAAYYVINDGDTGKVQL